MKEVNTLKGRFAVPWTEIREKVQLYWGEVKEHGLTDLRPVIREQGPVLWIKAQEKAKAAWHFLAAA
jgi:hypothetical protein